MDEETQKRIFEPFYTTKFAGRGLGMSAIRGIVTSHEGILQLTSALGIGTTFKVCFPVPEVSDPVERDESALHPFEKASGTVLLVEDEQTLRDVGKNLLETMGFSTLTAQHGGEAVEIYRERSREIDVILLDLIMPEMGGVEAYQELRKISSTLPIIICSGFGVESASDVIEHDPHAGFVHKPYKPGELRNELVRMMGDQTQ
jgi:CheY-like chemotaxis protein